MESDLHLTASDFRNLTFLICCRHYNIIFLFLKTLTFWQMQMVFSIKSWASERPIELNLNKTTDLILQRQILLQNLTSFGGKILGPVIA
jgi:hypothetical protein